MKVWGVVGMVREGVGTGGWTCVDGPEVGRGLGWMLATGLFVAGLGGK